MEIFFSENIDGSFLSLDQEESAHCVRVLRHRCGDQVCVIDGRGNLYRCTLVEADAKGAVARIDSLEKGFGAHPYRLTMAVCPTKNIDRFEWFVEKATEIGVDVVAPVIGDRSERKILKTERLRRLVLSAAKQSLKGTVPVVEEPLSVRDFILAAPEHALKIICYCFDGQKFTIPELLASHSASAGRGAVSPAFASLIPPTPDGAGPSRLRGHGWPRSGETSPLPAEASEPEICILIGPEGDFSPEEAALAQERGWLPVTLGKSRLRTETAALVAVTQVYSAF